VLIFGLRLNIPICDFRVVLGSNNGLRKGFKIGGFVEDER